VQLLFVERLKAMKRRTAADLVEQKVAGPDVLSFAESGLL
jgi:hypothetical protein